MEFEVVGRKSAEQADMKCHKAKFKLTFSQYLTSEHTL